MGDSFVVLSLRFGFIISNNTSTLFLLQKYLLAFYLSRNRYIFALISCFFFLPTHFGGGYFYLCGVESTRKPYPVIESYGTFYCPICGSYNIHYDFGVDMLRLLVDVES